MFEWVKESLQGRNELSMTPGTVPAADGKARCADAVTNRDAHKYSNTHRHACVCALHRYVHMKIKIRKKKHFGVHGRTSKLYPSLFLEKVF